MTMQTRTLRGIDTQGKIVETAVEHDPDVVAARTTERDRARSWASRKAEAQAALGVTDYLALVDRRPMTDAEKAYREALRNVVRAAATGPAPELPKL